MYFCRSPQSHPVIWTLFSLFPTRQKEASPITHSQHLAPMSYATLPAPAGLTCTATKGGDIRRVLATTDVPCATQSRGVWVTKRCVLALPW